jgi:hypothetical protein
VRWEVVIGWDWRRYERFRRDEVELFLRKARAAVWNLEPPFATQGGRRGYDARSLVLCALLKVKMKMDYRSISSATTSE